jgi:streptogrisin D
VVVAGLVAVLLGQANASPERRQGPSAMDTLTALRQDRIPGTAWAVDPTSGRMVITADATVTKRTWNTLDRTVSALGADVATLSRADGEFRLFAEGGDAIFAGNARCSLGFNVTTASGDPGFLTAGHCGVAADGWQAGDDTATVDDAVFPGPGDFAVLTYDDADVDAPSAVDLGDGRLFPISGAAQAEVGEQVFRMGSTTGLFDGQVTALNATVNYPEGTVTGLIQTTVCAEPGDSGGPMFTQEGEAVGLTSGGSGNCTTGGVTFFQPVTTALEAVDAQLGG